MTKVFNLQSRIDTLSTMVKTVDIQERTWTEDSLLARKFVGISEGIDFDILDLMLIRAPLPKIVMIEGPNGDHFEVISGHAVVETALAVINNPEDFEPLPLVRRIKQKDFQVVIFRCNMNRDDITFLAKKFYNIDVPQK